MQTITTRLAILLIVASVLTAVGARAQVSSTFDATTEGWVTLSHNTASWQAASGNPGGCLLLVDRISGAPHTTWASAPPKFLGDWSALETGDSLVFDVFLDNIAEGSIDTTVYRVVIGGPGGSAKALTGSSAVPPESLWTEFAIPVDAGDWVMTSGTWSELIANVTSVHIKGEYVTGLEELKVDNFRLTSSPTPVANPCESETFNTTGSISDFTVEGVAEPYNDSSEGNGGGFLRVVDEAGPNSFALAPSRFLGDWRPFEGTGWITVDIRVLSPGATNAGSPEFIRISGPGGSAYVALAPADIPHGLRLWKTFEYPIDSLVWTVDSGTWSGLVAYVEECRIDLEYYVGDESIGMDNFGRLTEGCGWIDNPVAVETPDFWFDTFYSLITPASAVFNPVDTLIYGVVKQTSDVGGLYYVTGSSAGVRRQTYTQPYAAIADTDGDMYVTETVSGNVYRLAYGGASSLWVSGFHNLDDDPVGMTFAPPGYNGANVTAGDILVVDLGSGGPDEVWAFSPDVPEGETLLLPDPGTYDFCDIASATSGEVYVCDRLSPDSLYTLSADGNLAGIGLDPPLGEIVSVVYDEVGQVVYAADIGGAPAVYRIDPASGATTKVFSGFSAFSYACLEIDSPTRRLWVSDVGYNRVYQLEVSPITGTGEVPATIAALRLRVVPNPFNPSAAIRFDLARGARVRLDVYDVAGRRVRGLFDGELPAGPNEASWDGRDDRGIAVASGVYFARLVSEGRTSTARLVLLK